VPSSNAWAQEPVPGRRLGAVIALECAVWDTVAEDTPLARVHGAAQPLLHRLERRELDAGYAKDTKGVLRIVFPTPTWEDYLTLAFDEIRRYGEGSIQVMRRLRSALISVTEAVARDSRTDTVHEYIKHLDLNIDRSQLDPADRAAAREEGRQGLGLTRKREKPKALPGDPTNQSHT
jgi:uncharacterized membrane protein